MNNKGSAMKTRNVGKYRLLAIGAAMATMLTGCAGAAPGKSAPAGVTGEGDVAGTIQLTWWGSGPRNEKTNAVADQFVKLHPGVTIKRSSADFSNYWTKLNVQAAGKSLPCVTQTQARQLNDYTKRNVFLPLDPMIKSGVIDVSQIPKSLLDTGRGPDGKLYMLPYGAAYDAIAVNTTLADAAGVGVLKSGYTWDDYSKWLMAAKDKLPEGVSATDLRGGEPDIFIGYVAGNNGGESLFNDKGELNFSKELLTTYWNMWEDLRKAGATNSQSSQAEEPTASEASYIATGKVMSDTRPGNRLVGMQDALDGAAPGQKLTTMLYASGSDGPGNVLITSGFSIPVSCNNVPTAAAFIDYFTNDPDAGKTFASDNGAATNSKVLAAQVDDTSISPLLRHSLELFQEMAADPKTQAIVYPAGYQAAFETTFTRIYQDIAFGKTSVEQGVNDFFKEANAGLS